MAVLIKDVEELLNYYKNLNILKRYFLPQSLQDTLKAFDANKEDNKKWGMALQVAHAYHQSEYSYLFLRSFPRLFFWFFPKLLHFSRSPIARIPFLSDDLLIGEQGKAMFTSIVESSKPYELIIALIALYNGKGDLWADDKDYYNNQYVKLICHSDDPHALASILCILQKNGLLYGNYERVMKVSNLHVLAQNLLRLDQAKLLKDLDLVSDDNFGQHNFDSIIEIISKGQSLEFVMERMLVGEVFPSDERQAIFELLIESINYSKTCDYLIKLQQTGKLKNTNKEDIQAMIADLIKSESVLDGIEDTHVDQELEDGQVIFSI